MLCEDHLLGPYTDTQRKFKFHTTDQKSLVLNKLEIWDQICLYLGYGNFKVRVHMDHKEIVPN